MQLGIGTYQDKGYQIGGMGGHGGAIVFPHLLGVAVVGGNHGDAAHRTGSVHHAAHTGINGFHRLRKECALAHSFIL